jgi:hypothetical protein
MEAVLVLPDPPTSAALVVSEVVKIDADAAPAEESIDFLNVLVSPVGIEPTTNRLGVGQRASADVHPCGGQIGGQDRPCLAPQLGRHWGDGGRHRSSRRYVRALPVQPRSGKTQSSGIMMSMRSVGVSTK